MDIIDIKVLREGGQVKRLHTVSTIRPHTVAEHSFNACFIGAYLCHENDIDPTRVLFRILTHDIHEVFFGDTPAPAKKDEVLCKRFEELEQEWESQTLPKWLYEKSVGLSHKEQTIVALADSLELVYSMEEEADMGNLRSISVLRRACQYCVVKLAKANSEGVQGVDGFVDYTYKLLEYVSEWESKYGSK